MNPYLRIPRFVAVTGFLLGAAAAYYLSQPKQSTRPPDLEAKKIRYQIHVPAGAKFLSRSPDDSWGTIQDAGGVIQVVVNGRHVFDREAKCDYDKGEWNDTVKPLPSIDVFADEGAFVKFFFKDTTDYKGARWCIFESQVLPGNFARWGSDLGITVNEVR